MTPEPKVVAYDVTKIPDVTCYHVDTRKSGGHGWATIYLRHGKGEKYYWAEVSVISDFGNFGYSWHAMGRPYQQFLARISQDYAMTKFMGADYMIFDSEGTVKEAKRMVSDHMKLAESKYAYRRLIRELDGCYFDNASDFLQTLCFADDENIIDRLAWPECVREKVNPQAQAFWDNCWKPFVEYLKAEVS